MIEAQLEHYRTTTDFEISDAAITKLDRYAQLIGKWNRITNLVASTSPDDLAYTHVIDCLAALPFIDGEQIVDIGSGAGLPGIVVAIMRPESHITLVDSRQRKARFLTQVAIELALANTQVIAQRIESWRPEGAVTCCVCRGFSSLTKFFDDTVHLHRPGGRLVALRGVHNEQELARLTASGARVSINHVVVPRWDHREVVTIYC